MIRYKRRKVLRYEDRPYAAPMESWGVERCAVLECGHTLGLCRASGPLPEAGNKRHACIECGPERAPQPPVTASRETVSHD